jgi:hypothetical protein
MPGLSRTQVLRCSLAALLAWLFWWYFAKESHYIADDSTVLKPLFHGSIIDSLHTYVRPLEFSLALLSRAAELPVWLAGSLLAYVATALLTLKLTNYLTGDASARWWRVILCVATPIAALPYFEIDTVSQALAVAFGLAYALGIVRLLQVDDTAELRHGSWGLLAIAVLTVLSKETSYGIVSCGSALLVLRHGRKVLVPMACVIAFLACVMLWSLFNTFDITPGSHYGFRKNPFYWLFTISFSIVVGLLPVPSSIAFTGAYRYGGFPIALMVLGGLAIVAALVMLVRTDARAASRGFLRGFDGPFGVRGAVLLFVLFSMLPSIFFKASELYASQTLPFTKALLVALVAAIDRKSLQRFMVGIAALWIFVSGINAAFYSISTGYEPARDTAAIPVRAWLAGPLVAGVNNQQRQYSVYSINALVQNVKHGACETDPWDRRLCLPPNIASGFPRPVRPGDGVRPEN